MSFYKDRSEGTDRRGRVHVYFSPICNDCAGKVKERMNGGDA